MRALRTAVIVVGAAALVATGIGAVAGAAGFLGVAAATWTTVGTIAGAVAGLGTFALNALAKKPAGPTSTGNPERFAADKNAGIPYVVGRTQTSGNLIHRMTYDANGSTNNGLQTLYGVWSGGGPVQELEAFKVDTAAITFALEPGGSVPDSAQGGFHSWMWLRSQLGATPESAALTATGFQPYAPGWSSTSKLSGYAAFAWTLRWDDKGKVYPSGVPKPAAVLKGSKVWDPRLDSSFPGGSGAQRADNEASWSYSENPWLHALAWALGRFQNGKRVLGIGMALAAIDVPAFVEAANIADVNGWKVGGTVYSTDGKYDALKKMMAAGGGEPLQLGGMLSCLVNTPRVPLATITTADIIGKASVTATQGSRDRINGVIPTYRSEQHDWSLVPASLVRVDTYLAEDGRPRTRGLTWELVQDKDQVAELAAYEIANSREFGPIVTPLKIRWAGYRPGDCLHIASPELGMDGQDILVTRRNLDPQTGAVTLTSRSETSAKHAFCLGRTGTAPPTPALQTVDRGTLLIPGVSALWDDVTGDGRPEDGATRNVYRGAYAGGATYAKGDQAADQGAIWNYINNTAGSGHAPPTLPTTSNAYWQLYLRASETTLVGYMTNESATVAAAADGTVADFSEAGGRMRLLLGLTEVTTDATFSVVSASGVSISITGAGSNAGTYLITGMSADTGTATLRASYGGINVDKVYSIAKSRAGATGAAGTSAKVLVVISDRQTISYDGAGNLSPASQTTTFTAQKQNTSAAVIWSMTTIAGAYVPAGSYLSSTTGDSVTMSAAAFDEARSGSGGVIVTGLIVDGTSGVTLTDKISVVRVAAGAQGNPGTPGNPGAPGADGLGASNRVRFSRYEAGATAGWGKLYDPAGIASAAPTKGNYLGKAYLGLQGSATAANQTISLGTASDTLFNVTPGERLAVQAGFQCYGPVDGQQVAIWYYDASGASAGGGGFYTAPGAHGYDTKMGGFVTVPAGAVKARLEFYAVSNGPGLLDMAITEPFVTQVSATATVVPSFTPGPNSFDGATRNIVTYSPLPPSSPIDGDLWVDTSGTYAIFKLRSGGTWITGANALAAYNALSGTPVALADINTTESAKLTGIATGATRNVVTYGSLEPVSPINGDLWVDLSGTYAVFKLRSGGAWVTGANALSAYNALSGTPVSLSDINTTESSKLAGIQAGATVGAPAGTNVGSTPATTVESGANAGGAAAYGTGMIRPNRIDTTAINTGSVSLGATLATTSVLYGNNDWQSVFGDYVLNLPYDATVYTICTMRQGYTNTVFPKQWYACINYDGYTPDGKLVSGAGFGTDVITVTRAEFMTAGSHTIAPFWWGASSLQMPSATLAIFVLMR